MCNLQMDEDKKEKMYKYVVQDLRHYRFSVSLFVCIE